MQRPLPPGNDEDDTQERCRINQKGRTDVCNRDHNTRQSRPDRTSEIKFDTVESSGSGEIFLRDQLRQDSSPRWAF